MEYREILYVFLNCSFFCIKLKKKKGFIGKLMRLCDFVIYIRGDFCLDIIIRRRENYVVKFLIGWFKFFFYI